MDWAFLVSGRSAMASSIKDKDITLGVGSGDGAWTDPPALSDATLAMQNAFGMVRSTAKAFVSPVEDTSDIDAATLETLGVEPNPDGLFRDDAGAVWELSNDPTQFLYCIFVLGFGVADGETMREYIAYTDTVFDGAVGAGQIYVDWVDVTDPGIPIVGAYDIPEVRNGPRDVIGVVMRF